jgi:hypothetical protein
MALSTAKSHLLFSIRNFRSKYLFFCPSNVITFLFGAATVRVALSYVADEQLYFPRVIYR